MALEKSEKTVRSWGERMSGNNAQKVQPKKNRFSIYFYAIISLLIIATLGWYFFTPSEVKVIEDKPKVQKKKVVKPTTVKPIKAKLEQPKEEVVMKRDRKGNLRPWKRPETYRDEKGVLRYKAGGARAPEKDEFKNAVKINTASNIPRFKYHVEHEIATLITLEPGGALIGSPRFDKRFEQDFINSLLEPVEINEEDSEYDKQLKRDVEATKRELAERIKAGENLADILTQTRDEIRRLAAIKQDLLTVAREETADPNMSEADVKDYYEAVNKLLEQKGIAPVSANSLMKRRAMRQAKQLKKDNQ